jgi:hypothetical protein
VQGIIWKADWHSFCQNISCFLYETRRCVTVFTKACHWTLSWASRIKFVPSILSCNFQLNVIFLLTPTSFQWSLTFGPPNQNSVSTSPLPHACHMSLSPHPPWFRHFIGGYQLKIILNFEPKQAVKWPNQRRLYDILSTTAGWPLFRVVLPVFMAEWHH